MDENPPNQVETPQATNEVPPVNTTEPKSAKKFLYAAVIIILLIGLGIAGYLMVKQASKTRKSTTSNASKVEIKKINIAQRGENFPTIKTAQGHSILIADINKKDPNSDTIIYDGKEVLKKTTLCQDTDCIAISPNGQHYAYVYIGSYDKPSYRANGELYVDGKLVKKEVGLQSVYTVSNDGKHYLYSKSAPAGHQLYLDGKLKYSGVGITQVKASPDLSRYILSDCVKALTQTGCNQFNFVVDGKVTYKSPLDKNGQNIDGLINTMGMSPNGQHYIYFITSQTTEDSPPFESSSLVVDGKGLGPDVNTSVSQASVTDDGHWAFINETGIFVGKSNDVQEYKATGYPIFGDTALSLSSDASHVFISYQNSESNVNIENPIVGRLDDRPDNLLSGVDQGNLLGAEFAGNTLYIYLLSQ